jgi:hypothetical protein
VKSTVFYTDEYKNTEQKIKDYLNAQKEFLSGNTVKSTRAVGDAIQDILSTNFQSIVGETHCLNYSSEFARRAMADLAFEDCDKLYYVVDVKTHRVSTKFNMPNLTSVERLARFYEDDRNYFVVLYIGYDLEGLRVVVTEVKFVPIEFLDWECLTLGALGWGQIQIANAHRIIITPQNSRKKWMLELCDALFEFYPREIAKISQRMDYFKKVQAFWEMRPDGP